MRSYGHTCHLPAPTPRLGHASTFVPVRTWNSLFLSTAVPYRVDRTCCFVCDDPFRSRDVTSRGMKTCCAAKTYAADGRFRNGGDISRKSYVASKRRPQKSIVLKRTLVVVLVLFFSSTLVVILVLLVVLSTLSAPSALLSSTQPLVLSSTEPLESKQRHLADVTARVVLQRQRARHGPSHDRGDGTRGSRAQRVVVQDRG